MPLFVRLVLAWSFVAPTTTLAFAQDQERSQGQPPSEPARDVPFTLELPEWNSDPATLPQDIRPLDVIRPQLPEAAAAEVAEFESKIIRLTKTGLTAESRAAQDTALDEAIALAERVLAIREEHQANAPERVRWSDTKGEPAVWHEIGSARQAIKDLRRLRGLDEESRAMLAATDGTDAEVMRLYRLGQYAQALAVAERQLDIRRRVLGDEHLDTLTSISNIGSLLLALGQVAEAEPYCRQALEGCRRMFGGMHPETLSAISNLGSLFLLQGRFAEAEPYFRQALEGYRRVLGESHFNTLTTVGNVSFVIQEQGRFAEAEPYRRQALEGCRRVLGDEHPATLTCTSNMGGLLVEQGRYADAEPYLRQALEGRRRFLGEDHPDTLRSANSVGRLFCDQGRLAEAEACFRQTLEVRRRVLGRDHPDTLISLNNMCLVLQQGGYADAETYLRQALESCRRVLGADHPQTLILTSNMANLLTSQGRRVEAEPYYQKALEGRRRVLGDRHPQTLSALADMGGLLQALGRLAEAEVYLREALELSLQVFGETHPDTLVTIDNLGSLLRAQGRLTEAEQYSQQAVEGFRRALGEEHPHTLTSIANMGLLLDLQGRVAEAETLYRQAMEVRRRVLGDEHPDTLVSINSMGLLLDTQGRAVEAEPLYREALTTAERLRVDVIGGAQERAVLAGMLNLPGIAAGYARTLVELDRAPEALSVLERGRSRAGLDLIAGGTTEADRVLRSSADADALARYDSVLAEEQAARAAVLETEVRMAAAPDDQKLEWRDRVKAARFNLAERTAAVFAELRGLVPAADPLDAEDVLAVLTPGEALLSYSWTRTGAVVLVARDGEVHGVRLAENRDESVQLGEAIAALRQRISSRTGERVPESVLSAARAVVTPEALRRLLVGASSLTVIAEGPLVGVPLEILLEDVPISYAPSATIAIERRRAADGRSVHLASAVVVGDPVFGGRATRIDPEYPETGVLLAMVQEGSNAGIAGLRRGDVLLSYAGTTLDSAADLPRAIQSAQEHLSTSAAEARPVEVEVWRDGEVVETTLALGRMGVQPDQRPPGDGLRSMAFFDRTPDRQASEATAVEQIRLYGGELASLPSTRLEAGAVAAMLGADATLLLAADATAPRLRDAVESSPPRVLHLATHGLLGTADQPLQASLALSTPEEPSTDDIGFLTLEEILATWGAQLRGTELVVLSACDTGRGVARGGTTMSLPLGFFVCGAETVIASLWNVDDRATALLMARFYANWLGTSESTREIDGVIYDAGKPLPKLAALREAKAWLRSLSVHDVEGLSGLSPALLAGSANRGIRKLAEPARADASREAEVRPYEHPYFWAAFILIGSPH